MSNAIEQGLAILALRGKGATENSVKQMAAVYTLDDDLTPDQFVTAKFEPAKAITAFGGYAVHKGLATSEQVINQRDVFGEKYALLDFDLTKDAFSDLVDSLGAVIITDTQAEARKNKANGNFATLKVNAILKALSELTPSLMGPTSQATKDALAGAGERARYLATANVVAVPSQAKVNEEVLVNS